MKKNFFIFCTATALMVLVAACTKQPTSSFKLSKTTAAAGENITATYDGENANTYVWVAWAGTTNTGASYNINTVSKGQRCDNTWTFNFPDPGTYTVQLRAVNYKEGCDCTDCSGKSDESTQTITIQ
jgi:hypothetical protein